MNDRTSNLESDLLAWVRSHAWCDLGDAFRAGWKAALSTESAKAVVLPRHQIRGFQCVSAKEYADGGMQVSFRVPADFPLQVGAVYEIRGADETDGYSQAYADQMRTALLRIGQEIAVEEVDPDDCRESIKRLVYEALMPPRSAVEPARELSASESASFAKTLARSPRRVEPECQHDLLKPKTTIVVDPNDSFHASCSACKHDFRMRAPLETSSNGWKCVTCGHENPRGALRCQNSRCTALSYSPEKATALPPGSCTRCGDTGFLRIEGRTENCPTCNR